MKTNLRLAFLFSFAALFVNNGSAQVGSSQRYITLPGSRLWLEGTSTINGFTCSTLEVVGSASLPFDQSSEKSIMRTASESKTTVQVNIAVKTLDCGNGMMNADMYKAMKMDEHPFIRYELIQAEAKTSEELTKGMVQINTVGMLTIAGKTNQVEIPIIVQQLSDGQFHITGSKPVSMFDYNITPPSAFFGLIKAHDQLVVHFDIIAAVDTTGKSQTACQESSK